MLSRVMKRGNQTWAWVVWGVAGLLVVVHFLLAMSAANTKSETFDEPLHLISGVGYWRYNDYRNQPENGNLAQRIIGLPDAVLPGMAQGLDQDGYWQKGSPHAASMTYLYGPGVDHALLTMRGRAMVALCSCALALLVFFAARRAWGEWGGLLALSLYALSPVVLANAGLMTSDLIAALFFTLATVSLWVCLHRLTVWRLAGLVGASGGLALAKFSFPLFFPIALMLALGPVWFNRPWRIALPGVNTTLTSRRARVLATAGLIAGTVVCVWVVIWGAYGFRYEAVNPALNNVPDAGMQLPWAGILGQGGFGLKVIGVCRDLKVLPEAYLYGMAFVIIHSATRVNLFFGSYNTAGTVWFYPGMVLVKTPLAGLVLLGWAMLAVGLRVGKAALDRALRPKTGAFIYRAWPWLALGGLFTLGAMASPLNIGIRHLLPAFPAGVILIGMLASRRYAFKHPGVPFRRHLIGVAGLALAAGVSALAAWPNYIAYFNPVAGDPATVYRRFGESNLDWGQDLSGLAAWAREHGFEQGKPGPEGMRFFTSYFGSARVKAYGVPGDVLPGFFTQPDTSVPPIGYAPGVYAISCNILMVRPADTGYAWTDDTETQYQRYKKTAMVLWGQAPDSPERQAMEAALPGEARGMALYRFEVLRFARMCAYLRKREPDWQINGSINLYKVTQEDLIQFFTGPMP
jgi:hypothetical protein